MIKHLHKLRAKRGFTLVELIVVIAIIAVMTTTILVGTNSRSTKISEANTTASDFYCALQSEFTNFQMFDGPLTMTLNREYITNSTSISAISGFGDYGGIKYYPAVGGNYPYDGSTDTGETHENGLPKSTEIYLEFYAYGNTLRRVNYSTGLVWLREMTGTGNASAQLCLVLQNEMAERMSYKDGYYYAKVSYTSPTNTGGGLSKYDYRSVSVKVDWAVYCSKEMTDDEDTYWFRANNILRSGTVCGVHTTTAYPHLGTTGTGVLA